MAALAAGLMIAGCTLPPRHEYAYSCPDGYEFTITYSGADDPGDIAVLEEASGTTKLPRAPAASGAHYSNGVTVFRSQDDVATLTRGNESRHVDCTT